MVPQALRRRRLWAGAYRGEWASLSAGTPQVTPLSWVRMSPQVVSPFVPPFPPHHWQPCLWVKRDSLVLHGFLKIKYALLIWMATVTQLYLHQSSHSVPFPVSSMFVTINHRAMDPCILFILIAA